MPEFITAVRGNPSAFHTDNSGRVPSYFVESGKTDSIQRLILTILLVALSFCSSAQTFYWINSSGGDWNNGANWSLSSGGSPESAGNFPRLAAHNVVFDGGNGAQGDCVITNTSALTIGAMTVLSSYAGTINQIIDLSVTGNATIGGGSFTSSGNRTLTVRGDFTLTSAVTWTPPQTIIFDGTEDNIDIPANISFINLIFEARNYLDANTIINNAFNVSGDLTLNAIEGTVFLTITGENILEGVLTYNGNNRIYLNSGVLNAHGNVVLNNTHSSNTIGGSALVRLSATSGTQTITGSTTLLDGSSILYSSPLPNLEIDCSCTINLENAIAVGGFFSPVSVSFEYKSGNVNPGTSTVIIQTVPSSNTAVLDGQGVSNTMSFYNLVVDVPDYDPLDLNSNLDVNGDLTMSGIRLNNNTISLAGDWINSDPGGSSDGFVEGTAGVVVLDGTTAQSISSAYADGRTGEQFYNLIINNSSADGVTFNSNVTVSNTLQLIDGIVHTGANSLILTNAASVTNASVNSFIDNRIQKSIANGSSFTFDVGREIWAPVQLANVATSGAAIFTVEYIRGEHPTPDVGFGLTHKSYIEYWSIVPNQAASTNLTLFSKNTNLSGITDCGDLLVAVFDTDQSLWNNVGNDACSINALESTAEITVGSISEFNLFTFASSNLANNPLPVELTAFEAVAENTYVDIKWQTSSELNNDFFSIERSADGLTFEVIHIVPGAGSTTTPKDYFFRDGNPFQGRSYYRLVQTDYDKTESYSDVKSVSMERFNIGLFPNPLSIGEEINILLSFSSGDLYDLFIRDLSGAVMYHVQEQGEINTIKTISITNKLSSGAYVVEIFKGSEKVAAKKMMIH